MNEEKRTPKPLTNGDRLRAMSNEELADKVTLCPTSFDKNFYCKLNSCRKCLLDWLNSPAGNERLQDCEVAR